MAAAPGAVQSAVLAELEVAAVLRLATKGEKTVIEGDDTAKFQSLHAKSQTSLELVSQDDLTPETYQITQTRPGRATPNYLSGLEVGTLLFGSAEQAMTMVQWLRETKSASLPGLNLIDYDPNNADQLDVCRVYWRDGKRRCGNI